MFTTLIDVDDVAARLEDPQWVIVDCRFSLADTSAGRRAYEAAHIPGAIYAHLEEDLSGPPVTDSGRHPLPAAAAMTQLFGGLGIDRSRQVVVYDDSNGAIASRLWWMLRYMDHPGVAVLNGGWQAWQAANLPARSGVEARERTLFTGAPRREWLVLIDEVPDVPLLVDSREPARYRGEVELLDPQAGHIPGAVNFYFQRNWSEAGFYLDTDNLRSQMEKLLGDIPAEEVVFYCGSGVTACANLLALAHAGLGEGRLYVGSWSEWCRDSDRPLGRG